MGLGREVILPAVVIGAPLVALVAARHEGRKDRAQTEERITKPLQELQALIEKYSQPTQFRSQFRGQVDSLADALFALVSAHDPLKTSKEDLSRKPEQDPSEKSQQLKFDSVLRRKPVSSTYQHEVDYGVGKEVGDRKKLARRSKRMVRVKINGDRFSLKLRVVPIKKYSIGGETTDHYYSNDQVDLVRSDGGFKILRMCTYGKNEFGHVRNHSESDVTSLEGIKETRNALLRIARVISAEYPKQILGRRR